jgi:hypothetical protein
MTTPEQKIKRKVTAIFKQYNVWYFMPANNGFGKSGIPDYIACVNGMFLGIECKADATKKPTALQIMQGNKIKEAKGVWLVVCDDETLHKLEATIGLLREE